MTNDHLLLIVGKSASGKSASLRNIKEPEGVMYLNCESNKKLPFKSGFVEYSITDPLQIEEAFAAAENKPDIHTIVIDSLTYLMDMYESLYVLPATNTMTAWGDFAQFFKRIMQSHVASSTKRVIFLAHVLDTMNEDTMVTETFVPIKGALKNNGVESYFSTVIAAKKVQLKELKDNESDILTVTDKEEMLGFKYVYQVQLTKKTVNERLRGPMGMFEDKEAFVDNDVQLIMDRFEEFYG